MRTRHAGRGINLQHMGGRRHLYRTVEGCPGQAPCGKVEKWKTGKKKSAKMMVYNIYNLGRRAEQHGVHILQGCLAFSAWLWDGEFSVDGFFRVLQLAHHQQPSCFMLHDVCVLGRCWPSRSNTVEYDT